MNDLKDPPDPPRADEDNRSVRINHAVVHYGFHPSEDCHLIRLVLITDCCKAVTVLQQKINPYISLARQTMGGFVFKCPKCLNTGVIHTITYWRMVNTARVRGHARMNKEDLW